MIKFSDYGFVNYKTLKEDWNRYKLKDGTIIMLKFVLIKFEFVEETEGILELKLNANTVIGILPAPELCGEPGTTGYTKEELEESVVEEDIDFDTIEESWNEYELEDGRTLHIKPVLTMISRTSKFDDDGEPIYIMQSQLLSKIK